MVHILVDWIKELGENLGVGVWVWVLGFVLKVKFENKIFFCSSFC